MKKISVIIPTRNRKEILFSNLNKLLEMNDDEMEILVYDDASRADYSEEIKSLFGPVRFYRTDKHVGYCTLRNLLVKASQGEFVINLDDDSCFASKEDYFKAKESAFGFLKIGIMGFKIIKNNKVQFPSDIKDGLYYYNTFMGCGYLFNRSLFLEIGGIDKDFFRQGEEKDLAIRFLAAGYPVILNTNVTVLHEESALERDHQFIHAYAFRNDFSSIVKYFPAYIAIFFVLKCILSHSIFCLSKLWIRAYFIGLCMIFRDFRKFIAKMSPLTLKILNKYLNLRKPLEIGELP